jgi:hypothetical protein
MGVIFTFAITSRDECVSNIFGGDQARLHCPICLPGPALDTVLIVQIPRS